MEDLILAAAVKPYQEEIAHLRGALDKAVRRNGVLAGEVAVLKDRVSVLKKNAAKPAVLRDFLASEEPPDFVYVINAAPLADVSRETPPPMDSVEREVAAAEERERFSRFEVAELGARVSKKMEDFSALGGPPLAAVEGAQAVAGEAPAEAPHALAEPPRITAAEISALSQILASAAVEHARDGFSWGYYTPGGVAHRHLFSLLSKLSALEAGKG